MKIVARILDQTVGSTALDSQGERTPKRILEELAKNVRTPLQQNHQPERPSIGYMENFKLVQDPRNEGEWLLKADIFFTQEPEDTEIALGGFSWSVVEILPQYRPNPPVDNAVYLPFPLYKNKILLKELASAFPKTALGAWYKKSADPTKIALVVNLICFLLTPVWKKTFEDFAWPKIIGLKQMVAKLRSQGVERTDFVQLTKVQGHEVSVYFIPEVGNEEVCLDFQNLCNGLQSVSEYAAADRKAAEPGYRVVKLYWDSAIHGYKLLHIEFNDGDSVNIIA
jgi:hypothetical protein